MINFPKFGDGICLARVDQLLSELNIDRDRLAARSIVVTGSNGKGSTSAFCESIARSYGMNTGLFTSPHLYEFSERFRIKGMPVGDGALRRALEKVTAATEAGEQQGFGAFEILFAVACTLFVESDCDLMIFEAGIGGRYDPVRSVRSRVTAVTSIDLEHTSLLGSSLELIVLDKTDACAIGGTVIYGENCLTLAKLITSYLANKGVSARFVGREISSHGVTYSVDTQVFEIEFANLHINVSTRLRGLYQINNLLIAAALFHQWLLNERQFRESDFVKAVQDGALHASWPGRLETISDNPHVIIDVGHTPDGINQTIRSLDELYPSAEWLAVVGVSEDKDISKIAQQMAFRFDRFLCTRAYHKGANPRILSEEIARVNPSAEILLRDDLTEAVHSALQIARSGSLSIVVMGGLFLAAEFAVAFRGGDPKALSFF